MTKYNKKIELTRVNMNLPSNLVQRIEEYALEMGVNSTNAYIFLLNMALDYKESLKNVPLVIGAINSIKDMGVNSLDLNIEDK